MKHLPFLEKALANLNLKVDYWDVRIEDSFDTYITVIDGETTTCNSSPSVGAFVRVRKNGFWFLEATTDLEGLRSTVERLAAMTRPQPGSDHHIAEKQNQFTSTTTESARFTCVSLDSKLTLVQGYDKILRAQENISSATVRYQDRYRIKAFLSSVGTKFEYDFNQGGISLRFTLKAGDSLFDDHQKIYGAEFSDLKGREKEIEEFVSESRRFLAAPAIEGGKYRVLLDPDVAGVFTHESFGHKSEADFMLGNKEALASWSLGKKIGADCLTIVDDGGHNRTSGWCPIDDEGTPTHKTYLIKNGVLTGRLHSRETAAQMGEKPTGNSRAMNFEFEPIVRMTSTYIEGGTESFESIVKRSPGALLVTGVSPGSGLSTFTISPRRGYRIKEGGGLEPVRLTMISGSVFDTLGDIEAVSSEFVLSSSALGGCGKNDQFPLPVSFGGPYVLVREMQVS